MRHVEALVMQNPCLMLLIRKELLVQQVDCNVVVDVTLTDVDGVRDCHVYLQEVVLERHRLPSQFG